MAPKHVPSCPNTPKDASSFSAEKSSALHEATRANNKTKWGYIGDHVGYIGVLEKRMETTILGYIRSYRVYRGNGKMETTISGYIG